MIFMAGWAFCGSMAAYYLIDYYSTREDLRASHSCSMRKPRIGLAMILLGELSMLYVYDTDSLRTLAKLTGGTGAHGGLLMPIAVFGFTTLLGTLLVFARKKQRPDRYSTMKLATYCLMVGSAMLGGSLGILSKS